MYYAPKSMCASQKVRTLIDANLGASDKDFPVLNYSRNSPKPDDDISGKIEFTAKALLEF